MEKTSKDQLSFCSDQENEEQYIYRICSLKDQNGFTWKQIADILNEQLKQNYGESCYRKKYQSFNKVFNANLNQFTDDDENLREIQNKILELEKARKKLQTEKAEYNKWLREDARHEMINSSIVDAINNLEPLHIPDVVQPNVYGRAYCLCFGDEHYSAEFEIKDMFGHVINAYSPEIFEERMNMLLYKVTQLISENNISKLYIFNLGDFQDGILRVSQLMKLRYGVVDATIKYAEYMANWLNTLSQYVTISFQMTYGNHSELRMLNQKKGSFKDDNMGKIVEEFIRIRLQDNPNFEMKNNPTGFIFEQINGFNFFGCHGEVKNPAVALREYAQIYQTTINYMVMGHLHHSKSEEIARDCEVINVPSIIGVCDYSMSLRKTAKAGATMLVIDPHDGLVCQHYIKLN